jgi:hypothetical protein
LKVFLNRLAAASHGPVLAALIRFLVDLQIGIARHITAKACPEIKP